MGLLPTTRWINLIAFIASYLLTSAHLQNVATASTPETGSPTNRFTNDNGYNYKSFNGYTECTASSFAQPTTLEDLQEIVRSARESNHHVKAVGMLHSFTDTICTDGMVVDMTRIKHFSFDPKTNYATVGAGMELQDFLELIHEHGRGLTATPTYGGITVGGAVGTGVHGTNLKHPVTISDQIVSVTFVDGEGTRRQVNEGDEDFKAFRVHVGLLGLIYELVLKTVPQYKLALKTFPLSDDILYRGQEILTLAKSYDSFQFYWYPANKQIIVFAGHMVPLNTTGNCRTNIIPDLDSDTITGVSKSLEQMQVHDNHVGYFFAQSHTKLMLYEEIPGRSPIFTDNDDQSSCLPVAVGFSHRMQVNRCENCLWDQEQNPLLFDSSAAVMELSEMEGAVHTIKRITDEFMIGFPLVGIHVRFLSGSDAYLGLNRDSPALGIEWVNVPRHDRSQPKLGLAASQALGQALVDRHGARTHWAKNGMYFSNSKLFQRNYPNLGKFVDVMNRMDPHEVFMNDFGRRLKYGSNDKTLTKAAQLRCALNEACLCQKDSDCGDGSPSSLICAEVMGYKVCQKEQTPAVKLADSVSREVINSVSKLSNDLNYLMEFLAPYKGFGNE